MILLIDIDQGVFKTQVDFTTVASSINGGISHRKQESNPAMYRSLERDRRDVVLIYLFIYLISKQRYSQDCDIPKERLK